MITMADCMVAVEMALIQVSLYLSGFLHSLSPFKVQWFVMILSMSTDIAYAKLRHWLCNFEICGRYMYSPYSIADNAIPTRMLSAMG